MFDDQGKHVSEGNKGKGLEHKNTYYRSIAICLGKLTMRSPNFGTECLDRGLISHLGTVDKVAPLEQLFPRNCLFSLCC